MSFDGLRAALRVLFWVIAYLGIVCAAVLAFVPAGSLKWVAWVAVLYVVAHDAHTRFTPNGSGALDG